MLRAASIPTLVLLTFTSACGGGSASTSPSPVPTPAATPSPQASIATPGFTFTYETAVSSADRTLIENGVRTAQALFQSRFGRGVAGAVTVDVKATAGPTQAQGHAITISTGSTGWRDVGASARTRTVVHETFHVLQGEAGWALDPTRWLFEGAAEYVGYAGAIESGLTSEAAVRACEVEIYFNGGGASTPRLEAISFSSDSSVGSRYAVGWLAIDRLTGGVGNLSRLKGMWENAGAWDQRFQTTFSTSPSSFYDTFGAYRDALQRGTSGACAVAQ